MCIHHRFVHDCWPLESDAHSQWIAEAHGKELDLFVLREGVILTAERHGLVAKLVHRASAT
jgi:hypothetical protein